VGESIAYKLSFQNSQAAHPGGFLFVQVGYSSFLKGYFLA
jgi:hypothetical protein